MTVTVKNALEKMTVTSGYFPALFSNSSRFKVIK